MTVKLEGWKEFADFASKLSDSVQKSVEQEMLKGGYEIERLAKSNAPVDTGRLKGSITTNKSGKGSSYQVSIGTDVEYAPHVEFGTYKQSAQPFLHPAFDNLSPKIIDRVNKIVDQEVGK